MKTITHRELVDLIGKTNGAMPVSLLTNTEVRMRKMGNPYSEVRKISRLVGFIGAKYQDAVNREAERQDAKGGFRAGRRKWGEWVIPNKVAQDAGKFYLRTQSTPGQRRQSANRVLAYLDLEGNRVDYSKIENFVIEPSSSRKQERVGLQDGNQIEIKEFAFSSIQKIKINGKVFRVINE